MRSAVLVSIAVCVLATGVHKVHAGMRKVWPVVIPELPADVIEELQHRNCRIPQLAKNKHSNVIQGEFMMPGQTDWAVLCSTKRATSLLVFWNGAAKRVTEVATRPNDFSSWSIVPVEGRLISGSRASDEIKPSKIDHQGISSSLAFGEPGVGGLYGWSAEETILYYEDERWFKKLGTIIN